MKILHWLRKENSGLFHTTVELAKYEERLGHTVSLRLPPENQTFYGPTNDDFDIHCIHSQIHPSYYKDSKPKMLFMHGEPDYSTMSKGATNSIMDLVPIVDAFIAFNPAEAKIWNSFKRTYCITKGVDLEKYKPIKLRQKLTGSPAILYCEHWRQFRNPLHILVALEKVYRKIPGMRFYPFGCPKEDQAFWLKMIKQNRYVTYCPGIFQRQNEMAKLLNLADIVVSPVFPSYGRVSLEALACNKPVVAYSSNPHATYKCDPYDVNDIAEKIIACCEEMPNGQAKYAAEHLDAKTMAKEAIEIYERFL